MRSLRELITAKTLSSGDVLPSSRELARSLGVSRITVVSAYEILLADGFLETHAGSRTVIASRAIALNTRTAKSPSSGVLLQPSILRPRVAPLGSLDGSIWRRAFMTQAQPNSFDFDKPTTGSARLRDNIATYLALSRKIRCTPDNVFIAATPQQAVALIAMTARRFGLKFHMEPCSPERLRRSFAVNDALGEALPESIECLGTATATQLAIGNGLFVIPSHSYPTGYTLDGSQRVELCKELDSRSKWVVEDYRDAEFLSSDHLSTLYEIRDGNQTIHFGTLSGVLAPYINVAYVVAPVEWVLQMAQERHLLDDASPSNEEIAAELIETGMFRVAARTARQVAMRRGAKLETSAKPFKFWRLLAAGRAEGLHAFLEFDLCPEKALGISEMLRNLDPSYELVMRAGSAVGQRSGLVLGFAATPDDVIAEQMKRLSSSMESLLTA